MTLRKIVLLDNGDFSFLDFVDKPLGGAQSAFIGLVNGLSKLGCMLEVRNHCDREFFNEQIAWKRLDYNEKFVCDGFIVNRSAKLLDLVPKGKPVLFWLHNRGNYLLSPKNLKFLWKSYPTLVFSGQYHRSTFFLWLFFKNRIIPYGLNDVFFQKNNEKESPSPKAIFTSNPIRSLDWVVDRWIEIKKKVPNAELHVFSGPSPYGSWGQSVADRMQIALQYAIERENYGIYVHEPVSKADLIKVIQKSRVMLYRGDVAETFCLSVAEAMELGVPCVTMDLGSMKERIESGHNGFVLNTDRDFVDKAVDLLSNDIMWREFHERLNQASVNYTWFDVAKKFIKSF
ncbi:MAG: glycosyltransferase [Algoriphagus aquaeductus]|uniref:glycosyltransferase n=1 Tax=Algoriphagus aquaeductus TaxID=475299 RepID=UPI00387A15D7